MKTLLLASSFALLTGCASWMEIPSMWDDNESWAVAKIRHSVDYLDCSGNYMPQARQIRSDIRFLELYASSKGSDDLQRMVVPMSKTAQGLIDKEENKVYCTLKKKQLVVQSATIADAAMERF